ncbi:hypothetical protein PPACK8108_LOCUS12059 [Phakopsora pachyrhizi]|uniref:Uncharacterized protein n=1 Tax=Phakopsora pachyrhizi TaxID=170000 RepID=A0AAV0B451_PHAPC|nr:hypothetical protein PPACK8108_LOCUS12059 [Phakopsora pachyrhizi]
MPSIGHTHSPVVPSNNSLHSKLHPSMPTTAIWKISEEDVQEAFWNQWELETYRRTLAYKKERETIQGLLDWKRAVIIEGKGEWNSYEVLYQYNEFMNGWAEEKKEERIKIIEKIKEYKKANKIIKEDKKVEKRKEKKKVSFYKFGQVISGYDSVNRQGKIGEEELRLLGKSRNYSWVGLVESTLVAHFSSREEEDKAYPVYKGRREDKKKWKEWEFLALKKEKEERKLLDKSINCTTKGEEVLRRIVELVYGTQGKQGEESYQIRDWERKQRQVKPWSAWKFRKEEEGKGLGLRYWELLVINRNFSWVGKKELGKEDPGMDKALASTGGISCTGCDYHDPPQKSIPTHVLKNTYLQKDDTLFSYLMPGVQDGSNTREFWSVGGKYKPVAKKVKPVNVLLPQHLNPQLQRSAMSRNHYLTPLFKNPPPFRPLSRITEERLELVNFGPKGWLSPAKVKLLKHLILLREKALAFCPLERGLHKHSYGMPYVIPVVEHEPWQKKAIPIPRADRDEYIELVRERVKTGLYDLAFCVKIGVSEDNDGKSETRERYDSLVCWAYDERKETI